MKNQVLKLLTIIVDEALKSTIEEEITLLGAKGYTLTHVEGKGTSGERNNAWVGENIKIETIVAEEISVKILDLLSDKYFGKYAIIAYCTDVNVMRVDHFI